MDTIYALLSEHNFKIEENLPSCFKCCKCKNILNEAKQTQCGCRYCSKCLAELVDREYEFCPGQTEFCKDSSLAEASIDYGMNRDISNIVVKCPYLCCHENKLTNMDEHMKNCPNKTLTHSGCGSEHEQEMENMRNEIQDLKKQIRSINEEIEILKIVKIDDGTKFVKMDGRMLITIENIKNRIKVNDVIKSEIFYGKRMPYKMSIWIETNGFHNRSYLIAYLSVYDDERNDSLHWPLRANVIVNLRNKLSMKTERQEIEIDRPPINASQCGDKLYFYIHDLIHDKLFARNRITIECIVNECLDE